MKKNTSRDYLLFGQAWLLLAIARAVLIVMPFKRVAPMLGKLMAERPGAGNVKGGNVLNDIKVAVLRAGRFSPWRAKCFEQAIAARWMLGWRNEHTVLYLGGYKDASGNLKAHAWLMVGDIVVTGGPDVSGYSVISWFVS